MIKVWLNSNDVKWARLAGEERMATAKGKPKWAYKEGRSGVDTHTIGAAAELAFCRALGLEWPARVGVAHLLPDVDPFWEIRWAGPSKLAVKTNDRADQMVALVHGKMPAFEIVGYCLAGWAQRTAPLEDPGNRNNPAHFIHESRLAPIDPDYHAICHYLRAELDYVRVGQKTKQRWRMVESGGTWICAICGKEEG